MKLLQVKKTLLFRGGSSRSKIFLGVLPHDWVWVCQILRITFWNFRLKNSVNVWKVDKWFFRRVVWKVYDFVWKRIFSESYKSLLRQVLRQKCLNKMLDLSEKLINLSEKESFSESFPILKRVFSEYSEKLI